jgi:hypothetical protein
MVTVALVDTLLGFRTLMVRSAILRAYFNLNDEDRDIWQRLLPTAFADTEQFIPIPLSMVLETVQRSSQQWQDAECELRLPFLIVWDPNDLEITANFELDVIPLTNTFIALTLEDNNTQCLERGCAVSVK